MKLLQDIFIVLFITFILFAASEMFVRFAMSKYDNQPTNIAYEFNKDYLVNLKPNIFKTYKRLSYNGNQEILWKTNSEGFRGGTLKESPDQRIIVYGDSSIQARFSKFEDTYTYKLEEYLNEKSKKEVEVINAGIIGMGPDQNLIRLQKDIEKLNPNIVIFNIFTGNDFGDILRNRLFELDTKKNLIKVEHKTTIDQFLQTKKQTFTLYLVKYIKRLKEKRVQNEKSIEISELKKLCQKELKIYKQNEKRSFSHFADHYDLNLAINPQSEDSLIKIKLMEEVLKKVKEETKKHNIKLLVLISPSTKDITTNNVALDYEDLKVQFPSYKQSNLTDITEDICQRHQIEYLNLFPVFQQNNPNKLFFNGNNNHWNDAGQDLAALETARVI